MKRLNCHRMVKQSLLLPSAAAYATLLLTLALAEDDCLWLAQNEHPASPLDYYDQLYRHSRTTPASLPALSISDWELGHYLTEPAAGWPQLPPETFWGQELIMPIKVYKGVVYVIWPHNDTAYRRDFWKHTREIALEQLLTAVWLYKDFPDVEFLLNTLDTPVASTGSGLQMPFLEYSAFNNTSPFGYRLPINPQHIVASNYQAKWCSGHGRGWVIPHQDAWEQLSLSPGQLQYYSYCTWSRYGTGGSQPEDVIITEDVDIPARKLIITSESQMSHDLDVPRRNSLANVSQQRKKVKRTPPLELFLQMKKQVNWTTSHRHTVFWRGSATGNQGGWASQIEQLTLGSAVPFEAWSQFQLTLSIDGNGPPYRLPRQLMSMVPVMKVDSNQREWFAESLKPGVHYEAVEYDLGDLTMRADALLTEAARDSSRLQAMAIAARDLAVSRSHLVAQLDAFMWSVAQLKKALQYQVQDPASPGNWSWGQESGWVPLQLPKDGTWISPGMRRFAKDIAQALPQNFV